MNIFEVLSQGRGRLNEENLSAILGFLLSPAQTHGLGDIFLRSFIQAVGGKVSRGGWFSDILKSGNSIKADVILESPYEHEKKKRIVDIDIRIFSSTPGRSGRGVSEIHRIVIENKIKTQSVGKDQLLHEFLSVINDISEEPNLKITMIYLTPGVLHTKMAKEFDSLNEKILGPHQKAWLYWTDPSGKRKSIETLIKNLLAREAAADIPPITEYLRHTLKAFVRHIVDSASPEKHMPAAGFGIEQSVLVRIKSGAFRIERYENSTIRIVNMQTQKYESSKKLLKKIAVEKQLGIDLNWESGSPKNTRDLGKSVMKALLEQGKDFSE